MQELLLRLVHEKEAHLKAGTHGITELWKEIQVSFIKSPIMAAYQQHFDPEQGGRKLRDLYGRIVESVLKKF